MKKATTPPADEQNLAKHLHHLENSLDAETLRELGERRDLALNMASRLAWQRWALPSASAAFASALLLIVFLSPLFPVTQDSSDADFKNNNSEALLLENIELYEDLEFYSWLAESEL